MWCSRCEAPSCFLFHTHACYGLTRGTQNHLFNVAEGLSKCAGVHSVAKKSGRSFELNSLLNRRGAWKPNNWFYRSAWDRVLSLPLTGVRGKNHLDFPCWGKGKC